MVYEFEGITHRYFPDFKVNGELVEVKSGYLFDLMQKEGTKDNAKYKCMLENNVNIILEEDILPYVLYVVEKYGDDFLSLCVVSD